MIELFIKKPVWNHLLMLCIFLFGAMSLARIKTSFFPETDPQQITIEVALNGASPEEVERGVLLPVERAVEGVEGIDQITSVAYENMGRIIISVENNVDVNDVEEEIKTAVDGIRSWPSAAEKPNVSASQFRNNAAVVTVYGEAEPLVLRRYADLFKQEIMEEDGVSQVSLRGVPAPEISVEISSEQLEKYQLDFSAVAKVLQNFNLDQSSGILKDNQKEIQIRLRQQKATPQEIAQIPLRTEADGSFILLGDIAKVQERVPEGTNILRYQNQNAALINIDKTRSEDILVILEKVKEKVEEFEQRYPYLKWEITRDATISLNQRIDLLTKNGLQGFFLVLAVLALFMNFRLAFWVALGIPISLAGMFIIMYFFGITINVISLFGMILVVGIIVDDAIVVGENIYQLREKGMSPKDAAIQGTKEVFWPVFMSILTTIIAFTPYFFFAGHIGTFIWHVAFVVIATLIVSLVESMYILPGHLAHSKGLKSAHDFIAKRSASRTAQRAKTLMVIYEKALRWIVSRPITAIFLYIFFLSTSIMLVKVGSVGITFFPNIPRDDLDISISLAPGSSANQTVEVLKVIEDAAFLVIDSLQKEGVTKDNAPLLENSTLEQGTSNFRESGSHAGKLELEFLNGEERYIETFEIAKLIREKVGVIPKVEKIDWGTAGRWGKPVSVSLTGKNSREVEQASAYLKSLLSEDEDLNSVVDNNVKGAPELIIKPTAFANSLGLSSVELSSFIRRAYYGVEVQRLQRSDDEVRLWVRMDSLSREGVESLGNLSMQTKGGRVPLSQLVQLDWKDGVSAIQRLNGKREMRVEAGVKNPDDPIEPILQRVSSDLLPLITEKYPGVTPSFEGRQRDRAKFMVSLKTSYGLALLGIYICIALVFNSFIQPLLVMGMIPLSLCGAIYGHGIMGQPMSFLSLLGIVALFGIVINDSIVYMDRINSNRKSGMPLKDSVIEAGLSRLRPILLTTISTVVGLAPLLLETSRQAKFLIPMAISVGFGLLLGSMLILILIPSQYYMLYRFIEKLQGWFQSRKAGEVHDEIIH